MKVVNWLLLLVSLFFSLWFIADNISIWFINHGVFSTVVGNFLEPITGYVFIKWLVWFAILFGWVGFAGGYYFWKHPKKLGFQDD